MNNLKTFGERLQFAMQERKISVAELADRVKISTTVIYQYLSEKKAPQINTIIQLSKALKTHPNYLLGFDNQLSQYHILSHIENYLSKQPKEVQRMFLRSFDYELEKIKYYSQQPRVIPDTLNDTDLPLN